jgi:hypothetical protein
VVDELTSAHRVAVLLLLVLVVVVLVLLWVCRANAGAAELAVLFNRLASVCEPREMSVKGLNTAKVRAV